MKINRNNYEAYLLDLLEGRLSAEDQQTVSDFLFQNPDCALGIEDFDLWILEKGSISFPGKEQLKKEIPDASFILTESNFDLFSIARLEGDLTREQEKDHASMLEKNEDKRKEWAEWEQTKLKVEPIIFAHKNQLKRSKGISRRMIWISVISSAAVITLLFTILRMEPAAPGSELAVSVETETPQLVEEELVLQQEIAEVSPQSKAMFPEDKPVLFSVKKNPEREKESQVNQESEDAGVVADSVNQVHEGDLQPKHIRIAGHRASISDFVNEGSYDHIKALDIPSSSIHLSSLSITQLPELDFQELIDDYTRENKITLWTIAKAGIKGINRLTGSEVSLLASRDSEGDVSGFRFKSKRFFIATPLEKSE